MAQALEIRLPNFLGVSDEGHGHGVGQDGPFEVLGPIFADDVTSGGHESSDVGGIAISGFRLPPHLPLPRIVGLASVLLNGFSSSLTLRAIQLVCFFQLSINGIEQTANT
jgi:hypothetical protein